MRKILIGILLGLSLGISFSLFAWVNPSQNPPSGGGVLQTSNTGLTINTSTYFISGNVGIGTTAPLDKLDINGNVRIRGSLKRDDTTSKYLFIPEQTNNNDFMSVTQLRLGSYMTLGNFGLGNSDFWGTNAILDYSSYGGVGSEGDANKFIPHYASGKGFVINPSYAGTFSFYGIDWGGSSARKTFPNDFTHIMTLTYNGNVGIGTTNPTSKLYVAGDLTVTGAKNFEVDYPGDPTKKIVYSSLEGPEAGTYIRGTAVCENQETQIVFPDHFRLVTAENGLTANLTPRGSFSSLYIKELNNERLIVGCEAGKSFDYVVFGIRKGYENFEVLRKK
jgi:hypothetical protein